MKTYHCEQGSEEWMRMRLGLPTASQFHRIITPSRLNASSAQNKYRAELLAEWLLKQPLDWGSSGWMERGNELEPEARNWYAFDRNVDVSTVGFVTTEDGLVGGSPDGLVGEEGGLEIKCLEARNHVLAMLGEPDSDYRCQVQGYLWLTGRKWWDLLFYNPELPSVVQRFEVDPEWVAAFEAEIKPFVQQLQQDKQQLAGHRVTRPWDDEEQQALELDELRQQARRLTDDPDRVEEIELLAHDGAKGKLRELVSELQDKV